MLETTTIKAKLNGLNTNDGKRKEIPGMASGKKEARPRYQRQPRNVQHHRSTDRSIPHRTHDLLGAALAVALCIVVIWGFGWAYHMGYAASEHYHAQEVNHA